MTLLALLLAFTVFELGATIFCIVEYIKVLKELKNV